MDDRAPFITSQEVMIALVAFLAGIAVVALDHFAGDPGREIGEYLALVGIVAAITTVAFGTLVLPALRRLSTGRSAKWLALSTGIFGLLTVVVFWSGAPVVLGFGAAVIGWKGRSAREGAYKIALVLGVLAFVGGWIVTALNLTGLNLF